MGLSNSAVCFVCYAITRINTSRSIKMRRNTEKKLVSCYRIIPQYVVLSINYTLYKNAGFWLVNSSDIFFTNSEFAEFLLHVGVFA
jgi:hypothetical protein